jgi:hypothetical protein
MQPVHKLSTLGACVRCVSPPNLYPQPTSTRTRTRTHLLGPSVRTPPCSRSLCRTTFHSHSQCRYGFLSTNPDFATMVEAEPGIEFMGPGPNAMRYGSSFRQKFTLGMPLVPTPARLKLLHACDQWHSSLLSTFLTSSHCKMRPNTKGLWG